MTHICPWCNRQVAVSNGFFVEHCSSFSMIDFCLGSGVAVVSPVY